MTARHWSHTLYAYTGQFIISLTFSLKLHIEMCESNNFCLLCERTLKEYDLIPVAERDGTEFGEDFVCIDKSDLYKYCRLCGNDKVFHEKDLCEGKVCEEHLGDSVLDYPDAWYKIMIRLNEVLAVSNLVCFRDTHAY